jgi:serine protease Do
MENTIDLYKNAIIQIATPWGTGTGFYIADSNLIATNRHVIEGTIEPVINAKKFKKTITKVLYTDAVYDLAFLEIPEGKSLEKVPLGSSIAIHEGQQIMAIGHPYGLKFTATQGIISKSKRQWNGTDYIQIDAAINPGNSGGPLINDKNEIIGVNTFIVSEGTNLGFALPVDLLKDSLNAFEKTGRKISTRCTACKSVIAKDDVYDNYCPVCGQKINEFEFINKPYIPSTGGKKIEDIIASVGFDIRLTRAGLDFWTIEEGSAKIKISYDYQSRYILAWTELCKLPQTNIAEIYEFLLRENNKLDGLAFSVMNQDIVITATRIYDEDLIFESGKQLFERLIKKSDEYDNVLTEMGAIALTEEE